jgi:hypothetical protein
MRLSMSVDDRVSGQQILMRAFMHIQNARLRRSIVALVKQIAGEDEPEQVMAPFI